MPNNEISGFWALPMDRAEVVLRSLLLDTHITENFSTPSASAEQLAFIGKHSSKEEGIADLRSGGVAVLAISGTLTRTTQYSWWSGMPVTTGYDAVRTKIAKLMADPQVKAVVLDIDSPGGSVSGCQELANYISEAAKMKPMAAFSSGCMASAAFWLGAATGRVFATATAEVGSIGVIMTLYDCSKLNERWGIKVNVISSGKYKAAGHPETELSAEQREYLEKNSKAIHAEFRAAVAGALSLEGPAEAWGDGQLFVAAEAQSLGLVSAVVGGLDEAVAKMSSVSKEETMSKPNLEAQNSAPEAKPDASGSFTASAFLACVKPLMSAESYEQARTFFATCEEQGFTLEQTKAMAALSLKAPVHDAGTPKAEEPKVEAKETDRMGEMLEAVREAHSSGVPSGKGAKLTPAQTLMAAMDKRGA